MDHFSERFAITRRTASGDPRERLVNGPRPVQSAREELGEVIADDRRRDADPVECAHRIGAGVRDRPIRVEPDEAITNPRGIGSEFGDLGEGPVDEHREQVVSGLQVDALELPRDSWLRRGVPGDDGDHPIAEVHRVGRPLDPAEGQRGVEFRVPAARGEGAHDVLGHGSRRRRRAHERRGDQAAVVPGGQPQDEVAQAEIGDEGPLAGDLTQSGEIGLAEVSSVIREPGQRRHVASVDAPGGAAGA